MIVYRCTHKFRNEQNKIHAYRLIDENNNIRDIKSDELKEAIKTNQITVINLKLTSNNRLINTDIKKKIKETVKEKPIEHKVLNRAILMGLKIDEFEVVGGKKAYLIHNNEDTHTLYIPSDVKQLESSELQVKYLINISNLEGNIIVTGGEGLENIDFMFYNCNFDTIVFKNFKPKQIKSAKEMFNMCDTKEIDLRAIDFDDKLNKENMFFKCKADNIHIENINKITEQDLKNGMFLGCIANIYLNENTYKSLVKTIITSVNKETIDNMELKVKILGDKTKLKVIRADKKTVINETIENHVMINILLQLYHKIVIGETFDKFKILKNKIDKLTPYEYEIYSMRNNQYNFFSNTYQLNMLEKQDNKLCISSIKDKNIELGVYTVEKDWLITGIELVRILKYFKVLDAEIADCIKHTKEKVEQFLANIAETEELHYAPVIEFNDIKERFVDRGIDIQIKAHVHVVGNKEAVRAYGHKQMPKYITVFYSENDMDKCATYTGEFISTNRNTEYATGAMYLVDEIADIAHKCKSGDIVTMKTHKSGKMASILVNGKVVRKVGIG